MGFGASQFLVLLLLVFLVIYLIQLRNKKNRIRLEKIISQRTEELEESKKSVEMALNIREKMITVFSHDIRGPLAYFRQIVTEIQYKVEELRFKGINKELKDLVITFSKKKPVIERRGIETKDILINSGLFKDVKKEEFFFTKEFTVSEYLGLLKSKSYVSDEIPKEKQENFFDNAREILIKYGDTIVEPYCTDLYLGTKK